MRWTACNESSLLKLDLKLRSFPKSENDVRLQAKLGSKNPTGLPVGVVSSNNDSMAIGIVQAAKENNLSLENLPILGVDATEEGLNAVAANEMACTIFQPAVGQGQAAVKAAIRMVKKESIASLEGAEDELYVWVPFEAVTKNNVKNYQ